MKYVTGMVTLIRKITRLNQTYFEALTTVSTVVTVRGGGWGGGSVKCLSYPIMLRVHSKE